MNESGSWDEEEVTIEEKPSTKKFPIKPTDITPFQLKVPQHQSYEHLFSP